MSAARTRPTSSACRRRASRPCRPSCRARPSSFATRRRRSPGRARSSRKTPRPPLLQLHRLAGRRTLPGARRAPVLCIEGSERARRQRLGGAVIPCRWRAPRKSLKHTTFRSTPVESIGQSFDDAKFDIKSLLMTQTSELLVPILHTEVPPTLPCSHAQARARAPPRALDRRAASHKNTQRGSSRSCALNRDPRASDLVPLLGHGPHELTAALTRRGPRGWSTIAQDPSRTGANRRPGQRTPAAR